MTLIAWQNGPIFRSGAVGTEQSCCCNVPICGCYYSGMPLVTATVSVLFDGTTWTVDVPYEGTYGSGTAADGTYGQISYLCTGSIYGQTGWDFLLVDVTFSRVVTNPYGGNYTETFTASVTIPLTIGPRGQSSSYPCNEVAPLTGTYTGNDANPNATVTVVFP